MVQCNNNNCNNNTDDQTETMSVYLWLFCEREEKKEERPFCEEIQQHVWKGRKASHQSYLSL